MIKNRQEFFKNAKIMLEGIVETIDNLNSMNFSDLNPKDTMLTIIDVNNGFARIGDIHSPNVEKLIPEIVKITEACLDKGIRVVAYTDCHNKNATEFKNYAKHCIKGSKETELVDELKAFEDKILVLNKNSTNGFISNNAFEKLKEVDPNFEIPKNHIIIGCVTDICVYQYTISLKAFINEHNIDSRIIIPTNGVDTFDIPKIHDADFCNVVFLNSLIANGVDVVKNINLEL